VHVPDHLEAQREFLPALETPFSRSLEINEPRRRYRWIDLDGVEYDKSTPILWIAAAQAAALSKPDLLEGPQRDLVLKHYSYVQELLKEYPPPPTAAGTCFPRKKSRPGITFIRRPWRY
jgi:hypothetical protein